MIQLLQLEVSHFAAIAHLAIEFGPGLNVLYGPNDLGKSTVAESIRQALLLPHSSTYAKDYLPWNQSGEPRIELTFTSGPQRIHRVSKQFGRAGSSRLEESRNGRDFDSVASGRSVDGELRRILAWGIREPGGAERTHGLPKSFLATALLSTQQDVSAILNSELQGDADGSGKEQIAKALETIAQDPKFLELLRRAQENRDAAYTDNGRKRTGQGTVFKEAADRVNEARLEVDRWQKTVNDAEGAVETLKQLGGRRDGLHEKLARAKTAFAGLEQLAEQTAQRAAAQSLVRAAEEELRRIGDLSREVEESERQLTRLDQQVAELTRAHEQTKAKQREAQAALAAAQAALHVEETNPTTVDVRALARKAEIAETMRGLEQALAPMREAKELANAALAKERDLREQKAAATKAHQALGEAQTLEQRAGAELTHCGLLEKTAAALAAEEQAQAAREQVARKTQLEAKQKAALEERNRLAFERAAIVVPAEHQLGPLRRLAHGRASAQGAREVGLVTTIVPHRSVELSLRKDADAAESLSTAQTQEVEAKAELEITIAGLVTVRVKGGTRAVQQRVAELERAWDREVLPYLQAAGVSDFEGLENKIAAAQQLDIALRAQEHALAALEPQLDSLSSAAFTLEQAEQAAATCRAALGTADQAGMRAELAALGPSPAAKLRSRRERAAADLAAAQGKRSVADQASAVADDRVQQLEKQLEGAVRLRDEANAPYPQGIDAALATALAGITALKKEEAAISEQLEAQKKNSAARLKQAEADLARAQTQETKAANAEQAANRRRESALAERAAKQGGLRELRKQRDAANLPLAEDNLKQRKTELQRLPIPARAVSDAEVAAARATVIDLESELSSLERDMQRAHGRLEQTGGAVARDRLADAEEAWLIAEQREREIEAEYEAWKLLLEQMKEADAAQASNLGLALTPAVAGRFAELTRRRYGGVKLSAGLETEGIVAAGGVRAASWLSVGTRDQLSTLFRLALAESLRSAIVLDDQLVQSDGTRMQWFRTLLWEKAREFQIIVLTCRPEDYLPTTAMVPERGTPYFDLQDQPVRSIDLNRALERHE